MNDLAKTLLLWLIGAVMPAKPGSRFARKQATMR